MFKCVNCWRFFEPIEGESTIIYSGVEGGDGAWVVVIVWKQVLFILFCSFVFWSGVVWSSLLWSGPLWSGLVWSGLAWFGMDWSGLVWFGPV